MSTKLNKSYSGNAQQIYRTVDDALLLKNAVVPDLNKKTELKADVLIKNGVIEQIGNVDDLSFKGEVIDLNGKMIIPGMLDLHVHFREPGREDKETLMSGAAAALAGGFTGVCTMPNTTPATDNREIVEFIIEQFEHHPIDVYPIAAITLERKGEQLVEMAELVDAGVVGFSDDGSSVSNGQVLRRALEYARMFNIPIIEHCEDEQLAVGGVMNEGAMSTKLGLTGMSSIAEDVVVARNIMLAEYIGGKMHIAHISTAGAVELVRQAKLRGVSVTAEVTPHHFSLTEDALENYDTNCKMSPPLRTQKDIDAIVKGLKDGTIDAIATDHAPHTEEEKNVEFDHAPFGILGLETALGLAITELVKKYKMSLYDVLKKLSVTPYQILGLDVPYIEVGHKVNMTILDPKQKWIVDKNKSRSRSRNTPFHGWELTGKPWGVINGKFLALCDS
ncbi:dihydroorotase [candidate division KSB1 bacterium]|nr:dihydroorotase [candidate division KSB1 bacterium]